MENPKVLSTIFYRLDHSTQLFQLKYPQVSHYHHTERNVLLFFLD